jgi:hypothetical protein
VRFQLLHLADDVLPVMARGGEAREGGEAVTVRLDRTRHLRQQRIVFFLQPGPHDRDGHEAFLHRGEEAWVGATKTIHHPVDELHLSST